MESIGLFTTMYYLYSASECPRSLSRSSFISIDQTMYYLSEPGMVLFKHDTLCLLATSSVDRVLVRGERNWSSLLRLESFETKL